LLYVFVRLFGLNYTIDLLRKCKHVSAKADRTTFVTLSDLGNPAPFKFVFVKQLKEKKQNKQTNKETNITAKTNKP